MFSISVRVSLSSSSRSTNFRRAYVSCVQVVEFQRAQYSILAFSKFLWYYQDQRRLCRSHEETWRFNSPFPCLTRLPIKMTVYSKKKCSSNFIGFSSQIKYILSLLSYLRTTIGRSNKRHQTSKNRITSFELLEGWRVR